MSGYSDFARFYDVLTSDIDYKAISEYYNDLIRIHVNGGILLDLACGTGTMSLFMAERGWDVIGVDASVDMLAEAKLHENVTYICQDMTELDLYGTIDAAICTSDGLNHLPEKSALLKTFERVSLFMNPGGVFVFDVNTIYKHETILSDNIFVKESDGVFCVWRNDYKGNGVVDITLDIFEECDNGVYNRYTEEIQERAYELDVIRELCEKAGFEIVQEREEFSKNSENAEKVVFVCRKNLV